GWPVSVPPELSERSVGEHLAVNPQSLPEDLDSMSDEQEPRWRAAPGHEVSVVKSGDHSLAGSGRGDDEIAVVVVDRALDLELLEHLLLVGVRADLEARETQRGCCGLPTGSGRQRSIEALRILIGVVVDVRRVIPVCLEGGVELVQERGGGDG